MTDTTIDEIFAEFGRKCSPVATLRNVDNPLVRREYIDQAKSALYDLILKEVVGEDEELLPENSFTDKVLNLYLVERKELRAEQIKKLKELFDE